MAKMRCLRAVGVVSMWMMYILERSVRVERKGSRGEVEGRGANGDGGDGGDGGCEDGEDCFAWRRVERSCSSLVLVLVLVGLLALFCWRASRAMLPEVFVRAGWLAVLKDGCEWQASLQYLHSYFVATP